MLISEALAQTTGGGLPDMGAIGSMIPLVLIFVVFYFLIIRPQQKKAKDHRAMVEALKRGDRVVTSGGMIGTVSRVINERELSLEIADNVRVRVMKGMIAEIMAKTEPVPAKDEKKVEPRPESDNDYYKALGLSKTASAAEIAAAARNGAEAEEAYETLKDPTKRKLYDSLGHDDYVSRVKA